MLSRIKPDEMSKVLREAFKTGAINKEEDVSIIFYDLSRLTCRINSLFESFPKSTLHSVSIKACPLVNILKYISKFDVGVEVSSLPELNMAIKTGIPPYKISYYSPAKTVSELEYALKAGVHINADNFQELERISKILVNFAPKSTIGIRINPQVGKGNILATSTAGDYSKLGIPLKNNEKEIIDSFTKYGWLKGVHVHVGSQGCRVELLVKGIKTVYDFVDEANTFFSRNNIRQKIEIFDIGGGLPVPYSAEDSLITMEEYKNAIMKECPKLFTNDFKLITEFGRYIFANAGWVASKVEYVKKDRNVNTAIIHVGADLFLRKCYRPEDWHHDITVADKDGYIKTGGKDNCVIAGPLCFSGDVIAKNIKLPTISESDYILVHDAGAYTLSTWSRHMSRTVPKVVGYFNNGEEFHILKKGEDPEDIWRFWS